MNRTLRTTQSIHSLLVAGAAALSMALPAGAQERNPRAVQPERPSVATHAGTVAVGYIELESGVELDRGPGDARNTAFVTVAKLGAGSHVQLSVSLNASVLRSASLPGGRGSGIGDATIGLKWRLLEAHPLLGDFAILPSVKLPNGSVSQGTGSGTRDVSLLVISSRDLGPVHLDINAGYTSRSGDGSNAPRDQWAWTVSFGGAFTSRLGWAAEVYGYPGTGGAAGAAPAVGVLYGPTLAVRDWLVLDAGMIAPVAGPQAHAVYAGATYNLGRPF